MTHDEARDIDHEVWTDRAKSAILLQRLQDDIRRARIDELRRAPLVLGQGDYERRVTPAELQRASGIAHVCWFAAGLLVGMMLGLMLRG